MHICSNYSPWLWLVHVSAKISKRKFQCQLNSSYSVNNILRCPVSLSLRGTEHVFSRWGCGDSGNGPNERGGIPTPGVNNFSNFRYAENPKQQDKIDNWVWSPGIRLLNHDVIVHLTKMNVCGGGGGTTTSTCKVMQKKKKKLCRGTNLLKYTAKVYCAAAGSYFGLMRKCKLAHWNVKTAICAWSTIYSAVQSMACFTCRVFAFGGYLKEDTAKKGCHAIVTWTLKPKSVWLNYTD